MQMPGITSGCRRKLKNALSYFEENTKSWNEKEKWLRANERVIKKYHAIEKTDDNYWQNVRSISRWESPRDRAKLFHRRRALKRRSIIRRIATLPTSRTLRDTWTPLARFAPLTNSKKQLSRLLSWPGTLEPNPYATRARIIKKLRAAPCDSTGPDVYKSLPQIFAD